MSVLECPACSLLLEAYQPLASGSEGWAHFKSRASSMCQGPRNIGSFRNLKVLSNQIRFIAIDAFSRSEGCKSEDFWVLSATCARAKADPTKNAAWGTIARACFILQKAGKVFYNQHSQHTLFHSCHLKPLFLHRFFLLRQGLRFWCLVSFDFPPNHLGPQLWLKAKQADGPCSGAQSTTN